MPDDDDDDIGYAPRSFWSGTITFGLVSIPVELYSANRSVRPSLRMLSTEGVPLRRAYFDADGQKEVDRDHIIRGYEIDEDRFILVSDEELEAIEPEKTRDIHLRRFVDRDAISPAYFRRSYFLAPSGQSTRPYAVLAKTMEATGKAGVATFVMRGKEYLVAIVADNGVLRAETMRFVDELRSRSDVGLGDPMEPPAKTVKAMAKSIGAMKKKSVPMKALEDERTAQMEALAERKREKGEDVVEAPPQTVDVEEGAERAEEPPDLVALLKRRLEAEAPKQKRAAKRASTTTTKKKKEKSKDELYEEAKKLDIQGRSGMSKAELVAAIEKARAA